jgi:pimeloyl-ACP methyl ester carboxylesterase
MKERIPLILLPGLGADHRLLELQRRAFPDLSVPPWTAPLQRESLPEYAARLAQQVRVPGPLVLGGVSLGGMVAYEMARHLCPEAVVLIASCRSRQAVRPLFRRLRPVLSRVPPWCLALAKVFAPLGSGILSGAGPEGKKLCVAMFRDADCRFMSWALGALLRWSEPPLAGIPVFQIHGGRDRLILNSLVRPDEVIPDGGHLINLTHAEQVNGFLRRALNGVAHLQRKR